MDDYGDAVAMRQDGGVIAMPDAPQATFAQGTPKRVIGWSTLIIVGAFSLLTLLVVAGALWLAGQDKALPGEIIALASMALTFMGKAIVDEVQA
jgi:hypothetical protein